MSQEITPTVFQEDVSESIDLILQDKLAKASITEQTLSELKAELSALNRPVTNKQELALVQGGITKATNIRNIITRLCEKGREGALMEQRGWIAKQKELVAVVKAVEEPLRAQKEAWEAEQARIEREALEAKEAAIRARFVAIEELGFVRKSSSTGDDTYQLVGTILKLTDISGADEAQWTTMLKSAEIVAQEEQDRIATAMQAELEAARLVREQEERLRLEREEMLRKEREFQEKQDAFNAQVNTARKNELIAAGMVVNGDDDRTHANELIVGDMVRDIDTLYTESDEDWANTVMEAKAQKAEFDAYVEEQAEKLKRQQLIESRVKALKEAGWQHTELDGAPSMLLMQGGTPGMVVPIEGGHPGIASADESGFQYLVDQGQAELARRKKVEEDRIAAEAVERERQRVQAEAEKAAREKQEREAKMGDVEKVLDWMEVISANAPVLTSPMGKHAVERLSKYVADSLSAVIVELKK